MLETPDFISNSMNGITGIIGQCDAGTCGKIGRKGRLSYSLGHVIQFLQAAFSD